MILVVTFGSLNPWISKESLNLILGQQGQIRLSLLSFVRFWCQLMSRCKPPVRDIGRFNTFCAGVFISALVNSPLL